MKRTKKLVVTLLAFSMMIGMCPVRVDAEEKGVEVTAETSAETVTVDDIPVVYADGRPVEDGHMFDLFDGNGESVIYTVKDGKLSGLKLTPDEQHKIDISWEDEDFSLDYQIVMGEDVSFKVGVTKGSTQLMRWFYDENGEKVKEEPVTRLVIKEYGEEDPVEPGEVDPIVVDDISVIYVDGRPVEDGHMFDLFDSNGESVIYTVKDGKLSGLKLTPDEQHKIDISWEDEDFSLDYQIVMGEDVSFKVGVAKGSTQLMRWFYDENGEKIKEEPVTKLVIKEYGEEGPTEPEKDPVEQGKMVDLADIPVVYEDGTPVEDGVQFDVFDMGDFLSKAKQYYVKDGKLSGIKMRALTQHKIGFDVANEYYKKYEVVGAGDSVKLLRVYAKYQNELPLYYDYDQGINAPEEVVTKLVIKKLGEGEESTPTRPVSCIMNLLLSDNGYQAEGGLPFHLIRVDNGKKQTIYSQEGELTLIAKANIEYRLELGENEIYTLDEPIEFSCLMDKSGKYQAIRKGGDVENPEDRINCQYIELTRIDGKEPEGDQIEEDPSRFTGIYIDEAATLQGMKVMELDKEENATVLNKEIKFVFYNATTQNREKTVYSKNGVLPDVEMMKGHNYIIFAEDTEYEMPNSYLFLKKTGDLPQCYKCGELEDGFYLTKRETPVSEKDINRVPLELPVYFEDGSQPTRPVKFRFVSPFETIKATSDENGVLMLGLMEDTNYMVLVDDAEYSIESFPLAIKDKSEYGAGKYPFNHFTCGSMSGLILVPKGTEHAHDTVLSSADGTTTVTGLNFRGGDYQLNVRVLPTKIQSLEGKDYEVVDIDTINMYRTEISKLAAGDFAITRTIPSGKEVKAVYYVDENGELHKVDFSQKDGKVTYHMNSMSLYNHVFEYEAKSIDQGTKPGTPTTPNVQKPSTGGSSQTGGAPQTGDTASIGMWIVTAGVSAVALGSMVILKKKNYKKDK